MSSISPVKLEGIKRKKPPHTPKTNLEKKEEIRKNTLCYCFSGREQLPSATKAQVAQVPEESHHTLPMSHTMVLSCHTKALPNCDSSWSGSMRGERMLGHATYCSPAPFAELDLQEQQIWDNDHTHSSCTANQ